MDLFNCHCIIKKSQGVAHKEITLFLVLFIFIPGVIFRSWVFKIRKKPFCTNEQGTNISFFKAAFSFCKAFLIFKHGSFIFNHHSGKPGWCSSRSQAKTFANDHGCIFFDNNFAVLGFNTFAFNNFIGKKIGCSNLDSNFCPFCCKKRGKP